MKGRRQILISVVQTGLLLIVAVGLLFLYKIPWLWMGETVPLLTYGSAEYARRGGFLEETYKEHISLYEYAGCKNAAVISVQSMIPKDEILLAEARDEESSMSFLEEMEKENRVVREEAQTKEQDQAEKQPNEEKEERQPEAEDAMAQEAPQNSMQKVMEFDPVQYREFDKLLQEFYVVDRSTYITAEELNAEQMLNQDLRLSSAQENQGTEGPQVLIYHTHSQEGYADSVPGDESMTVVGAGEKLAGLLEGYGIKVLHHKGQYDVENRDYAYANAEKELPKILEEHPEIEVIIDLHRDGVAEGTRLVTEIDGKPTAQFMFFNGLSRLKSTGEIDYLKNENRAGNLAFSFQLQVKCNEYYPGLARNIYLKGYRYNMQYRAKSLLVELGAQTNTVEEVYNALEPLAHVLAMVLLGEEI